MTPATSRASRVFWRTLPVALTALLAIGQLLGVVLFADESDAGRHTWLPVALVLVQAAVLVARYRLPLVVLIAVVVLDAATIVDSSGEVSTASFAVAAATYTYVRAMAGRARYLVPAALAVASAVVTMVALQGSILVPREWAVPFAIVRSVLAFGLAVVIAEVVEGRMRLLEALRERADSAERERERRAEEAVQRERTLMARELHDIAAHHLTGIIVSAQAADALRDSDPAASGEYLRQVQRDARTALGNLRQTVGLLRADGTEGELAPVASIDALPALVADASSTGTEVRYEQTGTPRDLGPLAGIAAYRMVQESLANALNHAPGAARAVTVEYGTDAVRFTVRNGPAASSGVSVAPRPRRSDGYGLLGMAERAELVGATLRTGPTEDGGWMNTLEIPYDGGPA